MNSLASSDLFNYCLWLQQKLVGAQLQNVWTDGEVLVLELHRGSSFWLCLDLNIQKPFLILSETKPSVKKAPKPVSLFLHAHAKNFRLLELSLQPGFGWVIDLRFQGGSPREVCELAFQMVPRSTNLLVVARSQGKIKKMTWSKPQELTRPEPMPEAKQMAREELDQFVSDYHLQAAQSLKWLGWSAKPKGLDDHQSLAEKKLLAEAKQKIRKKENAINAILESLHSHDSENWQKLGESLKYSAEVPSDLSRFYDTKISRSANRERAFKKAKDLQRKRSGTEARLQQLKIELAELQQGVELPNLEILGKAEKSKSLANSVLQKAKSKARKLILENGLEAVIGKSALDNLAILRQARAWDYWFHLRDYPGAHAILFRNKNQEVPVSAIEAVAQWVIRESVSKKGILLDQKYDVIVTECRFVRPIKGAVGSVNFSNERMFTFASKAER